MAYLTAIILFVIADEEWNVRENVKDFSSCFFLNVLIDFYSFFNVPYIRLKFKKYQMLNRSNDQLLN